MNYVSTLRFTRIALAALGATFVFLTFFWSLPQSAVAPPRIFKLKLMCVVPEGWSFFTRDPREPRVQMYALGDQGWESALMRGSERENAFGISRRSRVQGTELAGLFGQIPPEAWVAHPGPREDFARESDSPPIVLDNQNVLPTLEGTYIVERAKPIPWAWSGSYHKIQMPAEYVMVDVRLVSAADSIAVSGNASGTDVAIAQPTDKEEDR